MTIVAIFVKYKEVSRVGATAVLVALAYIRISAIAASDDVVDISVHQNIDCSILL